VAEKLESIKGIGTKIAKKFSEFGINTISDFLEKTSTEAKRKELAKKTGVNQRNIYLWTKQASFMQIPEIDSDDASLLVSVGLNSPSDFQETDINTVEKMVREYNENTFGAEKRTPSVRELNNWKKTANKVPIKIVLDKNDKLSDVLKIPGAWTGGSTGSGGTGGGVGGTTSGEGNDSGGYNHFFDDMAEVIVKLGTGIAEAQQELDAQAIETQKQINDDDELRSTGLMANWYTIPEVSLNLKMNYAMTKENSSSGQAKRRVMISPMNARYQNYFKVSESMQSELNLKFVPIPPPSKFSQPIYVPDVLGETLEEARKILSSAGLVIRNEEYVSQAPSGGKATEIKEQSLVPGEEVRFNDKIDLVIKKKK